jgi:hypothetical protein
VLEWNVSVDIAVAFMVPTTSVRFGRTKLVTFFLNGSKKQPSYEFIGEVLLEINVV